MRNFLIMVLLILSGGFNFQSSDARIIHVPTDSTTIQAGINGALDGDTVLVSPGLYYERINFLGKEILVTSNFIFDQDTNTIDSTIIDGDAEILGSSDTGCVVSFVSGEDSSSIIFGFTIRDGEGLRLDEYSYGGGIICLSSAPRISYNKIVNNYACFGGGICAFDGSFSPLIKGNCIIQNRALVGGGILCERSSPIIMDNVLLNNHADNKGGGIFFKICSPSIINNHIEKNSTDGFGGGICGHSGSLTMQKNKIIQNTCRTNGGGLYCAALVSTVISNNLFCRNSAESGGGIYSYNCVSLVCNNTLAENSATQKAGGILCEGVVYHPTIRNNIVCFSPSGEGIKCDNNLNPLISYNDVWNNAGGNVSGCPSGVGDTTWGVNFNGTPVDSFYNITQDPLFVDTLYFELSCNSPCIDAGDPNHQMPPDSGGCKIDMGFQEYLYVLGDANSDAFGSPDSSKQMNPRTHLQSAQRESWVDVGDILFIINYLFVNGPSPCPLHSADTNCDGGVNIEDIVCLLNHLFRQGPLPCL